MDKSSSRTSHVRQASAASSPLTASTQASATRFTKPNNKTSSFSRVKSAVKLEIDIAPQESEQAAKSDARLIGEIKKSVDSVIHELELSRMKSLSPRKTPLSARGAPSSLYANHPQQETPKRSTPFVQSQSASSYGSPYGSPYLARQTPGRNEKYFSPPPGGYKDRRPGNAIRVEDDPHGHYGEGEGPMQDDNFYTFNEHEEPVMRNSARMQDPRNYYSKMNMPLSARGPLPDQGQRYKYQASPFMETPKRSHGPGTQGFFQRQPNEFHQSPQSSGYEGVHARSTRDTNGMMPMEPQGYEGGYYMSSPNNAKLGRIVQGQGAPGNYQTQHPGYHFQQGYHPNMMPGPVRAQHGIAQGPYLMQGGQQDGMRHGNYGQHPGQYSMQYQPRRMENAGSMIDQPYNAYNAPGYEVSPEEEYQYRVNQGMYPPQQGIRAGAPKIYTNNLDVPQNHSQPRMLAERSIYQEKDKSTPGSRGYFIDIPKQSASRNSVGSIVANEKEETHKSYLSQHLQQKGSRKASEEIPKANARHKESIGTLQDVDLTRVEDSEQLKSYIAIKDSQIMSLAHLLEGLEKQFGVLQELRQKGNVVLEDAAITLREGLSQIIQNQ